MSAASAPRYRVARRDDVAVMMAIRGAVRENRLVSVVLSESDYVQAMTRDGRAWLCEVGDDVVGFSCGRRRQGEVWALFVRPDHEGRGIGSRLLELAERWLFAQGLDEVRLTTEPGTRAEALYRRRGYRERGATASGELEFVLLARGG